PAGDERPERARAPDRRREGSRCVGRRGGHPSGHARGVRGRRRRADALDGVSRPPIRLGHDVHDVTATPSALLLSLVAERGLVELRTDHWATASSALPDLGQPLVRVDSDRHETALYDLDGTLVSLGLGNGWAYVTVAAAERSAAGEAIDRLRELLPPPDPSAKHEVNVTFWTYTPHGPQ